MKVLWFTNNTVNLTPGNNGGGWMQVLERCISSDNNIQLNIATRARKGDLIGSLRIGNTNYYVMPDRRSVLQKRIDIVLNRDPNTDNTLDYISIVEKVKPDLIQVFGTEMDYGLICEKTKTPIVIHTQGVLNSLYFQLKQYNPSLFRLFKSQNIFDYIKGDHYKNAIRTLKRRAVIEEKILASCQNVIGRTDWDKRVMSILAPNARYYHCDEMLRKEFFIKQWQWRSREEIHITSVISHAPYKGHDNIVSTCLALKKTGLKFIWHIVGVNKSSSVYNLFYKDSIDKLSGVLQIHGILSADGIIDLLLNSSIYVHPSHIENSSNAICEAMALGMPVVALDVGGNASMINDGETGLIVPDNDPYSLAAVIKRLNAEVEYARNLGNNARQKALCRHNPEKIVSLLKAIYSKVVISDAN